MIEAIFKCDLPQLLFAMELPREIWEQIYLESDNSALAHTNRLFRSISQDISIRTKLLLKRYSIGPPKTNASNDQWQFLVQDQDFDMSIVFCLFHWRYHDYAFVEIVSEFAASSGNVDIMKWLVSKTNNIFPGIPDEVRDRALIQTSMLGHVKVAEILLASGADTKTDKYAALCMASKYGHFEVVRLLLHNNTDIHADDDYSLCWSSRNGHYDVVKLLLESGANVGARRGCALHWAAEHAHVSIVKLLLRYGANIHSNEDHALRWSTVHGHLEVVLLLIQSGADIHASNEYALRNAVKMRHVEIVKVLLDNGADPSVEDNECIKWALSHNDQSVVDLLKAKIK